MITILAYGLLIIAGAYLLILAAIGLFVVAFFAALCAKAS